MPEEYEPLIQCDSCQCLRRHTPCGSAAVPEHTFDQDEAITTAETGSVIAVELWRCTVCGNERVYGNREA